MSAELPTVIVVTIPNQVPRCYHAATDQIQVGRAKSNHLQIDDQAVSKTHCELVLGAEGQWIFRDLGSTNGSELNGQSAGWEVFTINDGDEIILGKVVKLHVLSVHEMEVPEVVEEDDDVNPVAAAVARQALDDMEGTQLIKLKKRRK